MYSITVSPQKETASRENQHKLLCLMTGTALWFNESFILTIALFPGTTWALNPSPARYDMTLIHDSSPAW